MANAIRQPVQERANEKKQKIIEAGYKLFAENGYYNTNTQEIAKEAGVSTGIVYSYFKDKKDILLYVLKIYIDKVTKPYEKLAESLKPPIDFESLADKFIDITIKTHKDNAHLHNTLHSLEVGDGDVNKEFMNLQDRITDAISNKLTELGYEGTHIEERVHLAMNAIQSFAHESVYDVHDYLDYKVMKGAVKKMVVSLFI